MSKFKKGDKFGTTQSAKYEVLAGPHENNNTHDDLYTTRDESGIVELKTGKFLAVLEEE
jgi:hypothetical protein